MAKRRKSDLLRDQERPSVFGYELDRKTLIPIRSYIDTSKPATAPPTEEDRKLLAKYGSLEALEAAGFYGSADKLRKARESNPIRRGSVRELAAMMRATGKPWMSDPEYLRLGNKALRVMPSSPKQRAIQARMREIEQRYGRERNPGASVSDIMRAAVKDLGGTRAAADYCRKIATQGGVDADTYAEAAKRLDNLTKGAERAAAYRDRERNPMRLSSKDPVDMSAAEINRELDKIDREDSVVNQELIDAGRGHEKYLDILKKDDPLSRRALALTSRRHKLKIEIERRAGPGMSRLPRGFGPRKSNPARERSSLERESSWVIVNRETGEPVMETFSKRVAEAVNTRKYEVVPILQWLQRVNRRARGK